MISHDMLAKLKRSNLATRIEQTRRITGGMSGVEVIILRDARYNGPGHVSLGELKAGDIAIIAGGDYYNYLEGVEMVIATAKAEALAAAAAAAEEPGEPVPDTTEDDWSLLLAGGVTEAQAQSLWAAGLNSKAKIVEAGVDVIVALGVSKTKATALVKWASS